MKYAKSGGFATMLAGGVIGLGVGFLAAGGPIAAGPSATHSNMAAKQARLEELAPARGAAAAVTHVELSGPRDAIISFRDANGREVYRSDALRNETLVVRDARIPTVTIRESTVDTASVRIVSGDVAPRENDEDGRIGTEAPATEAPAPASPGPTMTASR